MGWDNQAIVQLIINALSSGSGVFVYSGVPAAGNLLASITGNASPQQDPYGNTYSGIIDILGKLNVDNTGNLSQFNAPGATLLILSILDSAIIRYHDNGTAVQGDVAWALSEGTFSDGLGHNVEGGLTMAETAPASTTGKGQVYVADGSGGSVAGALYYLSPAGNRNIIGAA